MPNEQEVPFIPSISLDEGELKLTGDQLATTQALELVKQDFLAFQWYRQQNHDKRWNSHDALYTGWLPGKTWPGSTVARASLGHQIVFDQVEAAHPAIMQALFGSDPEWFQVATEPGADVNEGRAIQSHMRYAFEHNANSTTAISEIEMSVREQLLYGNGIISVEWDEDKKLPVTQYVDNRDIYIDPALPSPNIDEGRAVIRRRMYTIDELDSMRDDPRMKIPTRDQLYTMSRTMPGAESDRTKQVQEGLRGVNYTPQTYNWSPFPADRKIECLIRYSRNRIIWVFNREWVAYNQPNPYGFTPFCSAPCFIYPNRYYAQSFGDVLEGIQRHIEALFNYSLDRKHLQLIPPRIKRLGGITTPSQQRWQPGGIESVQGDPREWMSIIQQPDSDVSVVQEIQYLETMAEKRTGVNSLMNGIARPGNANRTATGMQMQGQGGSNRLSTIVRNIEDYMLIPMLTKAYKLIQFHALPQDLLPALGQDDQNIEVGPEAFQKPMRFYMSASSRMMTREKLQSAFPFIAQTLMNGPVLQQLALTGQTVDWSEFLNLMQDSVGTKDLYHLVRPMNPQEQQAMQQPPPDVVSDQQLAQLDSQTRLQMSDKKAQTEMMKAKLAHHAKTSGDQAAQQQSQLEMQHEMLSAAIEKALGQQKIQQKAQESQMDLQMRKAEMEHEGRQQQQKLMMDMVSQRIKLAGQHAETQQNVQHTQQEHEMKMQHQQQQHKQDIKHTKVSNKVEVKGKKALNEAKVKSIAKGPAKPKGKK